MEAKDLISLLDKDPRNKTSFQAEQTLRVRYPLYNLFIEFPTAPVVPNVKGGDIFRAVVFPAYINGAITDTFNPAYSDAGPVFGRMDSTPIYQRTTRTIKVDFHIPANDIEDARQIRGKLDIIAKNTYPTYKAGSNRLTIYKPPLIRIKFGNIICNPVDQFKGLLGYLNGGVSIAHDLSGGAFTMWPGQEIYAKKYSLSLTMNVLHEFTPGFSTDIGYQAKAKPEDKATLGEIVADATDANFLRSSAILSFPGAYILSQGEQALIASDATPNYNVAQSDKDRTDLAEKALGLK